MYKLLLIFKYLRRKLAPLFAAVAVTLCTAMVIIVISVMGGFLDMLRSSAKKLTGDVVVSARSLTGFAYYEQLIEELEAQPQVKVATPVIRTLGLMNLAGQTVGVMIEGVRPQELDQIVSYRQTLHWSTADLIEFQEDPSNRDPQHHQELERIDLEAASLTLEPPALWQRDPEGKQRRGAVIGIEVNPFPRRDEQGQYDFAYSAVGWELTLTVVPLSEGGAFRDLEPTYQRLIVVNEFKSGLYDVDAKVVFVPFELLQQMLKMEPKKQWKKYDPLTLEPIGDPTIRPGRTSKVLVRGAAGHGVECLREVVQLRVKEFADAHPAMVPPVVQTWEEIHGTLLQAVANEKGLVTFLFVIISAVAIVMVATTFYMIVLEKTQDIGVLRALGASRTGIANIFLGYGLAIGIVGSLAGLVLAFAIVTRLNQIQAWLANGLGVTVLYAASALVGLLIGALVGVVGGAKRRRIAPWVGSGMVIGLLVALVGAWMVFCIDPQFGPWLNDAIRWQMWDPQTYFFDRIPARIDHTEAIAIVLGAILSSVVGALIPALLAARLDPVEALRYE